jgi:hypothetical protein
MGQRGLHRSPAFALLAIVFAILAGCENPAADNPAGAGDPPTPDDGPTVDAPEHTISGRYLDGGVASGSVNGVWSENDSMGASTSESAQPTELWAFPFESSWGFVSTETVTGRRVFPILSDGTFAVTISELASRDRWVLVMADPAQEDRRAQLARYLSVPDASGHSLTLIEASDLIDSLGLGDVSDDETDQAVTTATIEQLQGAFDTLDASDLSAIARADNAVRTIENYWRNYSPDTGETYGIRLSSNIQTNTTKEQMTAGGTVPASYERSSSFEFSFRTNRGDPGNKTLVAPDGTESAMGISADGDTTYSYFTTLSFADASLPEGDWHLRDADSREIAVADFAFAVPAAPNDLPVGLIPSIQLAVDESGIVESVDVTWYFNTTDGELLPEPNLQAVARVLLGAFVQYNGGGIGYPESGGTFEYPLGSSSVPFEHGPDGMHIDNLTSLEFKYGTAAIFWEMSLLWE